MEPLKENTYVLLEPGTYAAIVTAASRGIVSSGKNVGAEKLDLIMSVEGGASVRDSLVFCESLGWKINQFSHACMLGVIGDLVAINDHDVIGLTCSVKLSQRNFVRRDGSDGVTNQVDRYVRTVVPITAVMAAPPQPVEVKSVYDDDVPF